MRILLCLKVAQSNETLSGTNSTGNGNGTKGSDSTTTPATTNGTDVCSQLHFETIILCN